MVEKAGSRSTAIMGSMGDVTIVWTEDEDSKMEKIIQKKMDEGMSFFIIEPRMFGLLPPKRTELKKVKDARKHRALAIDDEDFAGFVSSGSGDAVKSPSGTIKTTKRAETAKEAASGHSVGVKPLKGG